MCFPSASDRIESNSVPTPGLIAKTSMLVRFRLSLDNLGYTPYTPDNGAEATTRTPAVIGRLPAATRLKILEDFRLFHTRAIHIQTDCRSGNP